jgi:adenylyltransferase/sulfurtransferase
MKTMTWKELKEKRLRGNDVLLLDVRSQEEHARETVPGSLLIPLDQLPSRLGEMDPARETAVYCHKGLRSASAVRFLAQNGFQRVANMAGGIAAWPGPEKD